LLDKIPYCLHHLLDKIPCCLHHLLDKIPYNQCSTGNADYITFVST
jgi:hypothetical protein